MHVKNDKVDRKNSIVLGQNRNRVLHSFIMHINYKLYSLKTRIILRSRTTEERKTNEYIKIPILCFLAVFVFRAYKKCMSDNVNIHFFVTRSPLTGLSRLSFISMIRDERLNRGKF